PLVVSGAFHSPLMEYAVTGLKQALNEININSGRIPVYSNVHARPVTRPEEIKQNLEQQLTSPVRWLEIIENMIHDGALEFYEIGPGTVLKGLLKRINRDVVGKSIDTFERLESCGREISYEAKG
ncbi:MAG: ACP S-malonyltransferase, partial [bacterium]